MEQLFTVKSLLAYWPTRKALADDLGISKGRVDKWAMFGSIPAQFHAGVIRSAMSRGIPVTADDLATVHDRTRVDIAGAS